MAGRGGALRVAGAWLGGAVHASVDSEGGAGGGAVTTMCSGPTAGAELPGRRLGVSNH